MTSMQANTGPSSAPIDVQIILWDGVELLDFAGPGQVFGCAGGGRSFRVRTAAVTVNPIRSQGFLSIRPDQRLGHGPAPRVLVVPGGASEVAVKDRALIEGVGRVGREADVVLSVCTGALVIAAAGLLEPGMRATTWHGALDRLRTAAPGVEVVAGERWVDNGSIVTAAGVSAGIDAALHLVSRLRGPQMARETARYMEYAMEYSMESS